MLFKSIDDRKFSVDKVECYLEQLRPSSGFKVCPGIKEYPQEIRFQTKNLRQWSIQFDRVDSK